MSNKLTKKNTTSSSSFSESVKVPRRRSSRFEMETRVRLDECCSILRLFSAYLDQFPESERAGFEHARQLVVSVREYLVASLASDDVSPSIFEASNG